MSSSRYVEGVFRSYYEENSSSIVAPAMIERREFGFVFHKQGMLRHKSFRSKGDLEGFLRVSVPFDAYYSCAYYDYPEVEMEKKGWLGADLVFDIDADHIPTFCDKIHDEWTCGNCRFVGRGSTPDVCPACGGQKFEVRTWPCQKCLGSAKEEAVRLLDMLEHDFGFSKDEIHTFFSGHRGYHVHVESDAITSLDSVARKEIVDYVCGLGLDMGFHGFSDKKREKVHLSGFPHLGDPGWRGRIAESMYRFVLNAKQHEYQSAGLRRNAIRAIMQNKDVILRDLSNSGSYPSVKGVGLETWRKMAEFCVKFLPARVDTVVTTDVHRLIRLAGALHGKTGLRKVEFPVSNIDAFDPFESSVALKRGVATIFVHDAPEFRLGNEVYGPFKNRKVELATAAAVLLICKGRAEIVE